MTPSDAVGAERERLRFIDALRAIAALWVVLFHFVSDAQFDAAARFLPVCLVEWVFYRGHLGIWLFFVVSGFVMALAVDGARVDGGVASRLLARRLLRLMPPYHVSIVFVLAIGAVRGLLHPGLEPWPGLAAVGSHLVFAQGLFGVPALNVVYWTLVVELQFYIAFAALTWCCDRLGRGSGPSPRARRAIVGAASLAALLWPFGLAGSDSLPSFVPFWFAFLAGVLSFRCVRQGGIEWLLLGAYGVLLLAAAGVTRNVAPVVVAGTACGIAVVGATHRLGSALDWRPLQFVGSVSYSLYLLHDPLVSIVGAVTRRTMPEGVGRDLVGLCATLVVALTAAALLWRLVELPSQRWSRRAVPTKPRTLG